MRLRGAGAAAVAAVIALGAATRAAHAQQDASAEARAHFDRGLTLLNAQNYDGALAEFERSYALSPRPSVLYNIAVTLQALHRYPEAARALERYLRDAPAIAPQRRAEVQTVLAQLHALVARVRVTQLPAGATVLLDRVPIGPAFVDGPLEVGPGHHSVEARVGDRVVARAEFTTASGEERTVALEPVPGGDATASTMAARTAQRASDAPATLQVRAAANALITLDGQPVTAGVALPVEPGAHWVEARAPGRVPWRGRVMVAAAQAHQVAVRETNTGGLPPGVFGAALSATVVLGASAAVTGGLTLAARAEFDSIRNDFDPRLDAIAARGVALRTATNVLLIATGVAGITTVVLLTRTRFSPPRLTADIALAPDGSAASASVHVRF